MELIPQNLYLFLIALVLAVMEIQIEGKHAWATTLPAWKPQKGSLIATLGSLLFGGKTFFTGYHLAINLLILLFLFLPFLFGHPPTAENLLKTLSIYFLLTVVWDFLWIMLNPHFGISKYSPQYLWWFKRWLWIIPIDYLYGLVISLVILLPIINLELVRWWASQLLLFGFGVLLTVLVVLLFQRLHRD